MELNYWSSTECTNAKYDDTSKEWIVNVNRNGTPVTLRPKQLVFATGMSGVPFIPTFNGASRFKGRQHHSSQHPGGEQFKGQKVVVVGSNNSAHDICADLYQHGAEVTMLQRTTTHVARSATLMHMVLGDLYSERALASGTTTEKADLINASIPYRVMPAFTIPIYNQIKKKDADLYNRLEKAGFMLDFGDDGSGLFMKYLRRGSGYYIDVGASELVANGSIKLKSCVEIDELRDHSILLSDGTELEADVIVYATGYSSMNGWVAKLVSQQVADRVGKVWGLGSSTTKDPGPWEGELRNVWKPTKQDALWFHGGNLAQSRFYSSHLALQLKARFEGMPTSVYGMKDVYHKA
jgi:putative flavoprotein involved in K+ transport